MSRHCEAEAEHGRAGGQRSGNGHSEQAGDFPWPRSMRGAGNGQSELSSLAWQDAYTLSNEESKSLKIGRKRSKISL